MRIQTIPLLLLGACGSSDIGVKEAGEALCDGLLNEDESIVDGPFDKDGDGYYDMLNPDCVDTYPAEELDCDDNESARNPGELEVCNDVDDDCDDEIDEDATDASTWYADDDGDGHGRDDDTMAGCDPDDGYVAADDDCDDDDPDISPSAEEICEDDIDNDCDDDVDEDCPVDFTGTWMGDTIVSYTCSGGMVNISFSQLQVLDTQPIITISSIGSAQPGTMTGTISPETWDFNATVIFSGTCNESYTILGSFTDENTMEATFQWSFSGWTCGDCGPGAAEITATR